MENKPISAPHTVVIEDRHNVSISGVTDVESFDEQTVALMTSMGELIVSGSDLHINRIDVESGDLALEGEIASLGYADNRQASGGLFGRIFR